MLGTAAEPKLLVLSLMARRLRVTARWLREEAEAGRVPHPKADNRLLFNPASVERVLAERAAADPQEAAT